MDSVNERILQALVAGTDEDEAAIAARLSVSAPNLHDRIRSLERKHVIRGYQTQSPLAGGIEGWAFLDFTGPAAIVSDALLDTPWIRAAYSGPGPYPLLLRLEGTDLASLAMDLQERFRATGYFVHRIRPMVPTQVGDPAQRARRRANVDLSALGITEHGIILGTIPGERRQAVLAALAAHPAVASCRAFLAEPLDLIIEVAASEDQSMQDFVEWSNDVCGLQMQEYLPIERVLHGGPDALPKMHT